MMNSQYPHRLAASCAAGLEELVGQEVKSFGGSNILINKGFVTWQGGLEVAYRTCLWSRYASRVFLHIADFKASDEDALYTGALTVDWESHMGLDNSFVVDCSLKSALFSHSHFASLKIKDAIVDQFRNRYDARPNVDILRPDLRIRLSVYKEQATLFLDLSGESLHRRGYRVDGGGVAPLKESLAAAIVHLAGWNHTQNEERVLLDPMCGSGTLLIEAALQYGDVAPGLSRSAFGFRHWRQHDTKLWDSLVEEAIEREEAGMAKKWPVILGYDADPRAVALARENIENAGLEEQIVVKQGQLAQVRRPAACGLVVANPPYGERLSEKEEAEQLHRALGNVCKQELGGWQLGIFTSHPEFGDRIGVLWDRNYPLYNGPIRCRLYCGTASLDDKKSFQWPLCHEKGPTAGIEFANRLRKNVKKIMKWAKREGVSCYRIYDRDLQEYNVSVDIYEKWIQVQEYAAPSRVDEQLAKERFNNVLAQVRHFFGARRDRVFIKTRRKQKGKNQYQKQGSKRKLFVVEEGGCKLLVNFTDYLDTGIFLDHRNIRLKIAKEAKGKRFLNLFAYTGAASIHAAMGGAATTTTVDLSANYLHWARMNFSLNGLGGPAHQTVKADCMQWIKEEKGEYDLIFVDPPTFSNTKKKQRVFDVQEDHRRLLELAMNRLAKDGLLIFSTNFKRFQLDSSIEKYYACTDISKASIPFDFARNIKIHKCWEIRKKT